MQSRGFTKNAAGNWEKDGVEYDNNGQPIAKANPTDALNPLTKTGLDTALKIASLPSENQR